MAHRSDWRRIILALVLAGSLAMAGPSYADVDGGTDEDGTFLLAKNMLDLPGHVDGASGAPYEYGIAPYCVGDIPEGPGGLECHAMTEVCEVRPGEGPATHVYRRIRGSDAAWTRMGWTCYPKLLPGLVDYAKLADAFRETQFALPTLNIQPEGDVTLVRLPTYFEVKWPTKGFEPNEIDTLDPAKWFGMHIQVKPVLASVTYSLGDGRVLGPTASLGGPYPSGDIVAGYEGDGVVETRADVIYKGYVAIDDSEWIEIPGEVALSGTPTNLTIKTATNRLYLSYSG